MKTAAYCRVTAVQKSKGHSAAEKIKYIDRTGRYKNKPGFVSSGSGNLPSGFDNFHQFWKMADEHERANSVTAREFLIDLPDHLEMKDALMLAKTYAQKITRCPDTERPLPYQWAVHADENGQSRHMHLVMSERINDGIKRQPDQFFKRHDKNKDDQTQTGAPKLANNTSVLKRRTDRIKDFIERATNHILNAAGLDMTVDFKRTVKQGKKPQIKLKPYEWAWLKSGNYNGGNKRIDQFISIDNYNAMVDEQLKLDAEITDLEQLIQAEQKREADNAKAQAAPAPEHDTRTANLSAWGGISPKLQAAAAAARVNALATGIDQSQLDKYRPSQDQEGRRQGQSRKGPGL